MDVKSDSADPPKQRNLASMSDEARTEVRGHAWDYFDRHAEQRLKTFNFYVILCVAITAGFATIGKDATSVKNCWPFGFLLFAVSVIFSRLEIRNKDLVNHSEEALKLFEDLLPLEDERPGVPHRCKLFRREGYETSLLQKKRFLGFFKTHFTYSRCFRWLFVLFGLGGLGIGTILLHEWLIHHYGLGLRGFFFAVVDAVRSRF